MGAHTIKISDWSINMLDNLLNEERFQKFKNKPFWKVFCEQASWYSLAGIKDTFGVPNQEGWNNFKDLGWNSTTENDPIYDLNELIFINNRVSAFGKLKVTRLLIKLHIQQFLFGKRSVMILIKNLLKRIPISIKSHKRYCHLLTSTFMIL